MHNLTSQIVAEEGRRPVSKNTLAVPTFFSNLLGRLSKQVSLSRRGGFWLCFFLRLCSLREGCIFARNGWYLVLIFKLDGEPIPG